MEWNEQEAALVEKRELKNFDGQKMSEKELMEMIQDRITRSPYLKHEEIKIALAKGKLLLSGVVSSESNKLRLSELMESMPNLKEIRNQVEVRPAS